MVNAANTAWKLTDLWNTSLCTFDLANGWEPREENMTTNMVWKEYESQMVDLKEMEAYGLSSKFITLAGKDVSDKDRFILSSTLCKQQLMKLWTGDDWFYYVLGVDPRLIRAENLSILNEYIVAFEAMDPKLYHANSTGGSGSGKDWVFPRVVKASGSPLKAVIDLTDTSASQPTCDVQPVFWIIGGASTNLTVVVISDYHGRKLTYTPSSAITNGTVHVIMPYQNRRDRGFVTTAPTAVLLTSDGASAITEPTATNSASTWALDCLQHGSGTDNNEISTSNVHRWYTLENSIFPNRNGTTYLERFNYYPTALVGAGDSFLFTLTGTATDVGCYIQYCWVRV